MAAAAAVKYKMQYYGRCETTAEYDNHRRLHRLIVGLDIEWRPNTIKGQQNPVAILQIFVSRRCLIYQFRKNVRVPKVLKKLLKNPDYTFVGVGIEHDKQKLFRDHGLEVGKVMDLREKAAYELTDVELKKAGMKKLGEVILGKEVDHGKVLGVRMSDWEEKCFV
uniref:Werner Syndrome-like exonuclease n=1 Tax=Erigeron canadensis TaxID=72917 RepID=UPI001CB8F2F9|nr:Werner Syndrome-like exonuclease [Erigeron canadensis]